MMSPGVLIFLTFGVVAGGGLVWHEIRSRKLRTANWDDLVAAIRPISSRHMEIVARDFLEPGSSAFFKVAAQTRLEPGEIWAMMGRSEGLAAMRHNADVMIRLAAYVRLWDNTEAYVVSQRMRHDGLAMKRALFHIRMVRFFGSPEVKAPFHLQQAASSYYLMRQRLLSLYEAKQYVLYPRLAAAL